MQQEYTQQNQFHKIYINKQHVGNRVGKVINGTVKNNGELLIYRLLGVAVPFSDEHGTERIFL